MDGGDSHGLLDTTLNSQEKRKPQKQLTLKLLEELVITLDSEVHLFTTFVCLVLHSSFGTHSLFVF